MRKRKIIILTILAAMLLGCIVIGVAGCGAGDRLFYWPNNLAYLPTDVFDRHQIEQFYFDSSDGTRLHGWFARAKTPQPRGTVIYYHGNAQNVSAHYAQVSWLTDEGFNILLFDYRGFGKSRGRPNRKGIHQDSVAAMNYALSRTDVDPHRLVAFGQSLGGACLVAALGEFDPLPVRAVAVESTFASYRGVGREKLAANPLLTPLAWLASCWLLSADHDPQDALEHIKGIPLLVIHGDADNIVPFSQGRQLYEKAAEPKHFEHVPGGAHCDAVGSLRFGTKYRRQLVDFFDAALAEGR